MNRREFVKETFAVAGAALFGLGCSKEASANETSTTKLSLVGVLEFRRKVVAV